MVTTAITTSTSCCIADCKSKPSIVRLGCPNLVYCNEHYKQYRHNLNVELQVLTDKCNRFREEVEIQTKNPQTHPLMKSIDEWEKASIAKIKQLAQETRDELWRNVNYFVPKVRGQLENLRFKIPRNPYDREFVDTDIKNWTNELDRLKWLLKKTFDINFLHVSTELIPEIHFTISVISNIPENGRWKQNGVTVAGGNGKGNTTKQLNQPFSLFVDDDQTVFIIDFSNHRIIQWKKGDTNGQIITGDNGIENRLNRPTNVLIDRETDSLIIADSGNRRVVRRFHRSCTKKDEILIDNIACWGLAMDDQRYLYVSDIQKHEVRRYRLGDNNGVRVAGGNGKGNGLNKLNGPTYLFVDRQQNVYVSDKNNHRVMKWDKGAEEGLVIAGGKGSGNSLSKLNHPNGIFVDTFGTLYVADSRNHRVMRWSQGDKEGTVIVGGNGKGTEADRFNVPNGLCFDQHGNLYVADGFNYRVQRFSIE